MVSPRINLSVALVAVGLIGTWARAAELGEETNSPAPTGQLATALERLESTLPAAAADYGEGVVDVVGSAAEDLLQRAVDCAELYEDWPAYVLLAHGAALMDAHGRVERLLDATLEHRREFAAIEAGSQRREMLRRFLRVVARLNDLSGRLHYLLSDPDTLDLVEWRLVEEPARYAQLLDAIRRTRSSAGAGLVAASLLYPLDEGTGDAEEVYVSAELKRQMLETIREVGDHRHLWRIVRFLQSDVTTPATVVAAVETIRALGLPQDPRPERDVSLPDPATTAAQLIDRLRDIATAQLSAAEYHRRGELLAWLESRAATGLEEPRYRVGHFEVQPGDWLLMRNPSPYNLFTDLSPGLYTHVGIVALEEGGDGRRRMVIVDLPERGATMPATNVDAFLERTLDYVFLRQQDQQVAETMGEVARRVIGNPTQFDLNFRTTSVEALRGQPLEGQKITAYCAGLLLLCAQETELPRQAFFPIPEYPAGGQLLDNLGTLGLSIGEDFVSPTGGLFAAQSDIVGRARPMYDPRREVEQAVFDHFASSLETRTLAPSHDLYQSLRLKVAQAASGSSLLSGALAQAAGVSEETDLVAAARAAAVVETLDEVAYKASGDFLAAREAIMAGGNDDPDAQVNDPATRERFEELCRRHSDLYEQWMADELSPRELRRRLVAYYIAQGKADLDGRFFDGEAH